MKGSHFIRTVSIFSSTLFALFVLVSCYGRYQRPIKPFSYEKIPEEAVISMNFNAKGYYFVADKDGKPVQTEMISFESVLKKANKQERGWIEVLGSYSLFQTEKGSKIWLCDKDLQCVEGHLVGKADKAVFSVNYDGTKLFLADMSGNKLYADGKESKGSTKRIDVTQGSEVITQMIRPFASLVQDMDPDTKYGIKALNTFIVFKVRGSCMIPVYNPITRKCCLIPCP